MAVPKRHVLEQLALLAASEEEREKLLELASPEGADLYHEVSQGGAWIDDAIGSVCPILTDGPRQIFAQ